MIQLFLSSKSAGDKASHIVSFQRLVIRLVSIVCYYIAEFTSLLEVGHKCYSELFLSLLVIRYVLFCYSLGVSAVIVHQYKLQIPLEVQNMKVHNIYTGMFSGPQQSKGGSIAIQLLCPSFLLTESRGLVGSGYNPFSNASPNIIQH